MGSNGKVEIEWMLQVIDDLEVCKLGYWKDNCTLDLKGLFGQIECFCCCCCFTYFVLPNKNKNKNKNKKMEADFIVTRGSSVFQISENSFGD